MISPKHAVSLATTTLAGAILAASFQAPASAYDNPERDNIFRHDKPITGHEIVRAEITLRPNSLVSGEVRCPAGKKVLGGGYHLPGILPNPEVVDDHATDDGRGWLVSIFSPLGSSGGTAIISAQCAFAR
ncbi:hypothetical protein [Nonomuraea bangladeshensis]|uniref:hypothetical protein n=1 Tax=Nonomuraea bangladeshensis TaxID=404385 RepID=UPI0031D597C1